MLLAFAPVLVLVLCEVYIYVREAIRKKWYY